MSSGGMLAKYLCIMLFAAAGRCSNITYTMQRTCAWWVCYATAKCKRGHIV